MHLKLKGETSRLSASQMNELTCNFWGIFFNVQGGAANPGIFLNIILVIFVNVDNNTFFLFQSEGI